MVILNGDPARGGAERYTIDLAHELERRNLDIRLLASSFTPMDAPAKRILLEARGLTRATRYESFLNSLDHHLSETSYDVIHSMLPVRRCDIYHPHAGIAAEAILLGHEKYESKLGRTLSRVGNRLNRRRQRFLAVEQSLLTTSRAPTVLCLSEYVKEMVRKHYALPEKKLATLFNAVDLQRFDPDNGRNAGEALRRQLCIADDQVVALMIAQDFERKGLRQSIAALAQTPDPRLVLLVVGKQDVRPYKKLATAQGVSERVIFIGPTTDTYRFYCAADFLILPTHHDPCSLVVLEALAMGVPVISTRFNGACEIMQDGIHGFVLNDPSDINVIARTMRELLDAGRRQEMSEACLQLRPRLSFQQHVDQLLDIYAHRT